MSRQGHPQDHPVAPSLQIEGDGGAIVALWLVTAYLLLIIGGIGFFRSGQATVAGNPLSYPRAIFTAVNAATLTGFQQSVALDSLQPAGKICAAVLMIGGSFLTICVSTIAVARILRKRLSTALILLAAAIAQIFVLLIGGFTLRAPAADLWPAMFQAASAFNNCGLTLGAWPGANDSQTYLAVLPLAIVGGLGLPVLIELFTCVFRNTALSKHTRTVLMASAAAFLVAFVACAWFAMPDQAIGEISADRWRQGLSSGLIAGVNTRTAGMPIEYVYDYPRAMQWLLIALMFVGGAPAGAAGGLKVTTLVVLFSGARRALRSESPGRSFGIAIAWLAIFSLLIFFSMLWLLQSAPEISSDRALFITVSAASNVGLSPDPLSITAANGYAISMTMLLGRMFPMGVLWWMASTTRDAEIAVG
ncbi:TrkH family potassium uptake protein [soil metagenome]